MEKRIYWLVAIVWLWWVMFVCGVFAPEPLKQIRMVLSDEEESTISSLLKARGLSKKTTVKISDKGLKFLWKDKRFYKL